MKRASRSGLRRPTAGEAKTLTAAICSLGDYTHVTVEAQRGFLYVYAQDEPVVRLTQLGPDHYGLSFHHHTGRWDPTPFTGDLSQLAGILVNEFHAYLIPIDFPPVKRGSDY